MQLLKFKINISKNFNYIFFKKILPNIIVSAFYVWRSIFKAFINETKRNRLINTIGGRLNSILLSWDGYFFIKKKTKKYHLDFQKFETLILLTNIYGYTAYLAHFIANFEKKQFLKKKRFFSSCFFSCLKRFK